MKFQVIITGITHDTFVQLHETFQPRTIIMSHQWHVSSQTFDIEINDKVIYDITDGDITLFFNGVSFTIQHDNYCYFKCM